MEGNKSKVYRYLSTIATGIVGKTIKVMDVLMEGALGYTQKGSKIHVAFEHELYSGLNETEKTAMRTGITVHEALHQVYTNFTYANSEQERLWREGYFKSEYDEYIYHQLFNLIEDPAIEGMASQVVGGTPLKALRYTIKTIDEKSDYESPRGSAIEELTSALIQFGDIGLVRDNWQFEEAKECFLDIADDFYDAINEPDGKQRVNKVLPILEKVRKLYPETVPEDYNKNKLSRTETPDGSGKGKNGKKNSEDSTLNRKRKITIKKVKRDEWERMKKEAEGNKEEAADNGRDITVYVPEDGKEEKGDEKGSGSINGSISSEEKESTSKEDTETTSKEEKKEGSEKESKESSSNPEEGDTSKGEDTSNDSEGGHGNPDMHMEGHVEAEDSEDVNPFELTEEEAEELDSDDMSITEEDMERIEEYARKIAETAEDEGHDPDSYEKEEHEKEPMDFEEVISSELHTSAKCENYVPKTGDKEMDVYERVKAPYEADISMLQEELRDIFHDDSTKSYYARSGRVNLKRMISGSCTTRLFERKERSTEKESIAVYILVDMSGSTSGIKIEQERLAAILTAESLSEFNIPVYITGFTENYNVQHYHFVRWDNTPEERASLLQIRACGNNFDAYAIRYAEEMLKMRNEKRKLMIVISDGQPASNFSRGEAAIKQNAETVLHAKESGIKVVCFGVGNVPENVFKYMYGNSFIDVSNPSELFNKLAGVLRNVIDGTDEDL